MWLRLIPGLTESQFQGSKWLDYGLCVIHASTLYRVGPREKRIKPIAVLWGKCNENKWRGWWYSLGAEWLTNRIHGSLKGEKGVIHATLNETHSDFEWRSSRDQQDFLWRAPYDSVGDPSGVRFLWQQRKGLHKCFSYYSQSQELKENNRRHDGTGWVDEIQDTLIPKEKREGGRWWD